MILNIPHKALSVCKNALGDWINISPMQSFIIPQELIWKRSSNRFHHQTHSVILARAKMKTIETESANARGQRLKEHVTVARCIDCI